MRGRQEPHCESPYVEVKWTNTTHVVSPQPEMRQKQAKTQSGFREPYQLLTTFIPLLSPRLLTSQVQSRKLCKAARDGVVAGHFQAQYAFLPIGRSDIFQSVQ